MCGKTPSVSAPSAYTVFGLMYDYVCSKHKAYAKATRTTAEGAGDPGIGQPTRRCPPFICIAKFAHVQIEIYDAE